MREVVVSGIGLVTPSGLSAQQSFDQWVQGKSAVGYVPEAIRQWLPDMLAACVPAAFNSQIPRADQGFDRAVQLGMAAASEAMHDAQCVSPERLKVNHAQRSGVYVGIGLAGAQTLEGLFDAFYRRTLTPEAAGNRNPTIMHPLTVPRLMANATAAAASMRFGLQGASHTFSVACASSAVALGEAFHAIKAGYLDRALVIGTEAQILTGPYLGWNALRVLATPDSQDVAASCKPFDAQRSGFVLGEGAGALVLEARDVLSRPFETAYGLVCGYGASSDAEHLTAPSVDGQVRAMQQALAEAAIAPEQLDYINAHGTATKVGDAAETASIQHVFGAHALQLPISATKSMHGHLIGAAGAVEMAATLLSMQSGILLPTAHLDHPDAECPLDYVPKQARHGCHVRYAMSNSFAFGGSNVALVVKNINT